jgi:hypothetical protein
VEYFGDVFSFTSPELPDGLVIIEGSNGSGKTTFADLIYFALGGPVKKFMKKGNEQHKEIREDLNNGVKLTLEINGELHYITRRFDAPSDILLASKTTERVEVLPVVRREGKRIFSDWLLESLNIHVVTLFFGMHSGKLNFTDVMRLVYHDQDPDPSKVFKKPDHDNFVSDSREFRRAIFEILIGRASESYYEALGELKNAQVALAERESALSTYRSAIERAARARASKADANADFLKKEIAERERQVERLEQTRQRLRREAPARPAGETALLEVRQRLASVETKIVETETDASAVRDEKIRLLALREQLADEVERIKKIIHAHETLALFSPDTCPCCLRKVDRAKDRCICGKAVAEAEYQRFFYSSEEFISVLKSKQKNVQTVSAALQACDKELIEFGELLAAHKRNALQARKELERWAGVGGTYSTELEGIDDELVNVRIMLERLMDQLDLELERDKLERSANEARLNVERLQTRVKALEAAAQQDRAEKVDQFNESYTALMRTTLRDVRSARLDADYEPVLNDGEYREASATVTRRLMYFVALLQMSLSDTGIAFPRFLLVDTPQTAGIDRENLFRAISKIPEVLNSTSTPAQVILTTGDDTYPSELNTFRKVTLTDEARLLVRKSENPPTPPVA